MKVSEFSPIAPLVRTPSLAGCLNIIRFNYFFVFASMFFYLVNLIVENYFFFGIVSVLLVFHAYLVFRACNLNFLYYFRYFLVWILIFGTSTVWFFFEGKVNVAPWGLDYQNLMNTSTLVAAGCLSLGGSVLGWFSSFVNHFKSPSEFRYLDKTSAIYLIVAGMFLTMLIVSLYMYKVGGILSGGSTYGGRGRDIGFEFGIFNVVHFTGLSLILVACHFAALKSKSLVYFCIVTLFLGVLSGSRADFLPQIFIFFILLLGWKKKQNYTISHFKVLGLIFAGLVLLALGYLAALLIALWRDGLQIGLAFDAVASRGSGLLINDVYGHPMLYFETGNMMLGGLYSAIVQVKEDITGLLLGESYFNYLLIAPPAFFGLPRPQGLEWATDINGLRMTQGGIFEVAEAYWNFGLIGCFGVSYLISRFFGGLLVRGVIYSNPFYLLWYLVMGFMGLRAVWYQNFSYFRIATVMIVIFLAIKIFAAWFSRNRTLARYL